MLHKSFGLTEVKADGQTGEFTATVAVFNNIDLGGDRILPGAFAKSLQKWRAAGDPIPIIWNHDSDNPMAHIGVANPQDVIETANGLLVKGTLDVQDNDYARQVHRLMKRRSLKEFSFGYRVPKGGEKRASDGANDLTEIDLIETGPTLKGLNPVTELHSVKSMLRKQDAEMVRLLNSMAGQARKFIDSEDDAEDVAAMHAILSALTRLGAAEQMEPPEGAGEKADWSTAYVNDLPDSAFLYIEDGGSKDSDGKTMPRSLRHFPYRDASGNVDLPHLRNALARIPQSNLPQAIKDRVTAHAERVLNGQKSDGPPPTAAAYEAPQGPPPTAADPVIQQALKTLLSLETEGVTEWKSPEPPAAEPPSLSKDDAERRYWAAQIEYLTS